MDKHSSKTYADVGINISETDAVKKDMEKAMAVGHKRMLSRPGAFASLYDFHFPEYEHPVLVMKTEEPGSKQKLAFQYDCIESIAKDMIHHLINDIIVMGAKPLIVQDAIIAGKLEPELINRLLRSMVAACEAQECVLSGGETSIQPGVLEDGAYILTSSIVGVVEKDKVIDGSRISEGDLIIGVASNGLHTNGYTLIRSMLEDEPELLDTAVGEETFQDVMMRPHLCYYKGIKRLLPLEGLHGMAHITGGGMLDNVKRILPDQLDAVIRQAAIPVPDIFEIIKQKGNIGPNEMFRTFNMGIGFVLVIKPDLQTVVQERLHNEGYLSWVIGEIQPGSGNAVWQ